MNSPSHPHLRWLTCEHNTRPPRTSMHLVQHHVLQLLVVHRAHEDVRLQGLACVCMYVCMQAMHVLKKIHLENSINWYKALVSADSTRGP